MAGENRAEKRIMDERIRRAFRAGGDQIFHHEDWACAAARRKHAGLPMAADGRRVTCFSCLRTGIRQLVVVIVPRQIGGARRERDAKELERAIASAAGAIRDSVRTGASIDQAIGALAVHGPQRLREEFAELARAMPLYGREEALSLSQDRVNHPAWDSAALTLLFVGTASGRSGRNGQRARYGEGARRAHASPAAAAPPRSLTAASTGPSPPPACKQRP